MDPRRWWLLAGVVPVAIACAVAASDPALRPVGDLALMGAGLTTATILWVVGGRRAHGRFAWRLLATAPLFPVLGAVVAAVLTPSDPLELAVIRWLPTVPGYLIAIAAILALVDRARLRAGGLRLAVELVIFTTACLVVVQLLIVGPNGRWSVLALGEQLVLGAAVVVTSTAMAAALTVLGVIEARRQSMALVLLIATVGLTVGRGLGTSALLSGALAVVDTSRFLIAAGLLLLAVAGLMDPGPGADEVGWSSTGRSADLGQVLPHIAMAVAATAVGVEAMVGSFLSPVSFAGAVLCVAMAAVHRWVTARETRRMAARLARSEAYFRSLVRSSGDAVVILDDALRVSWASAALAWTLGPAAPALVGRPLLEAVHPDDAATLAAALPTVSGASPVPGGAPVPAPGTGLLLLRLQDADGVWRYLEAGVSDLRRDADVGAVVLQCRDMTDRHERERALLSVAYTDPLTGLPNRAGFLRGLHQAVSDRASTRMSGPGAGPAADELPATLLMIELDGLADARDHAGREVMTTMVAEIGRRLRATVRGEDLVARLGGGGFAVLTDGGDADADRLASRCLSVVEQPIVTAAGIVDLTARVGVVSLEEGLSVEEALGRADLAVRAAHAAGPGSAARYRPALGEAAARLDRLRTDLQDAAARGQFFLLFQPVVSLQEQRVTGVEALLRWRHPVFGDVEPDEFLPIAERAGLIGELMRWSLQEATAAAAALPAGAAPRIGLNAPTGYVATGTLVADVQAALQRSGLPPERLVLEISAATVMLDDERTGLDMSTLRLMGVHVALDDFGGDRSALAHLTRLPIDIVKLHRSFITRLDRDPQSRALCESVVGIARALGMDVVAQGVETPAQLAALCGVGCDFAQGFLISRPVPLAALVAMLTDGAGSLWPGLVGSR